MSYLYDVTTRFWEELTARSAGPLAFRFILQPTVSSLLAIRDGYKDAQKGRSPYFWTILKDPTRRSERLREGLIAVSRVILLGLVMDAIYQFIVLKAFRPVEMIVIVIVLAFIPYLIVRGPAERIFHRWAERSQSPDRGQTLRRG